MYSERTEVEKSIEQIKGILADKPEWVEIPWPFGGILKLCGDWLRHDDELTDLRAELLEKEDEVNRITEEADMYSSEVEELKATITTQETQIAELTAQVAELEDVAGERNEGADDWGRDIVEQGPM